MKTYNILELSKLTPAELHDVADALEVDPEITSRQAKMYAILDKQATTENAKNQ